MKTGVFEKGVMLTYLVRLTVLLASGSSLKKKNQSAIQYKFILQHLPSSGSDIFALISCCLRKAFAKVTPEAIFMSFRDICNRGQKVHVSECYMERGEVYLGLPC